MPFFFVPVPDVAKPTALVEIDPNTMPRSAFWESIKSQTTKSERHQTFRLVQSATAPEVAASSGTSSPKSVPHQQQTLYERRHVDGRALPPITIPDVVCSTARVKKEKAPRSAEHRPEHRPAEHSPAEHSPAEQAPAAKQAPPVDDVLTVKELKSISGMTMHTNMLALQHYTNYNQDGSLPYPEMRDLATFDTRNDPAYATPLFARKTIRTAIEDPVVRQYLDSFMRKEGGVENLEFIAKTIDYEDTMQMVAALTANLYTTFTSVTATKPLDIPDYLQKAQNDDIRHVCASILPGFRMLFGATTAYVENRIVRDIYPAFVVRQFSLRLKAGLGMPRNNNEHASFSLPGLGSAFCLVDPDRSDNAVIYASDSFARTLGYASSYDVPRNGRLLRIPKVGSSGVFSDSVIMVHRHQTGEPFWGYVSVCPITTHGSRVRFLLVGLVDLSPAVGTRDDVLRALCVGTPAVRDAVRNSTISCANTEKSSSTASAGGHTSNASSFDPSAEAAPRPRSRKAWRPSKPASSSSLFQMFSRKRNTETAEENAAGGVTHAPASAPSLHSANATQPIAVDVVHQHIDNDLPVYAPFMLLQFVPGTQILDGEYEPPSTPRPFFKGLQSLVAPFAEPAHLKVAVASQAMLELLGIQKARKDAFMYQDVFGVLSGLAGSRSVTSEFRSTVCKRVVASASASMELAIPARNAKPAVPGVGLGTRSSPRVSDPTLDTPKLDKGSTDTVRPSTGWRARSPKMQAQSSSPVRPSTGDWDGTGQENMRNFMSHWTPLKDEDGSIAWVVLVLTPTVKQA